MSEPRFRSESEGIVALVRETVDGIGRLISDHLKLARLEMDADIRTYGRSLAVLLLVAAVFALAYGMACIGLALVLSRWLSLATAFFIVAGAHAVIGAVAATIVVGRLRGAQAPMRETVNEVQRSVGALTSSGAGNGVTAGERTLSTPRPATQPASQPAAGGSAWPTIRT